MTLEIAVGGMLIALFVGFGWGWKQCEEKFKLEESMREAGKELMARAIRDGIIDSHGLSIENHKPVEKPK